ncbi:SDR family NAD(P)-dependent oxidoreductase [Bordetella trematum]|uniref:SDR family NAD(P)-dependent oxidoreductase n=1 Tax=Bordetella trematum TaxID=123899 RepID=UPI0015597D1A|nr:SDR family oxidoreductase [Bordetella trematum]
MNAWFSLQGRRLLFVGAGSDIARATADAAVALGAEVIGLTRDGQALRDAGVAFTVLDADLLAPQGVASTVAAITQPVDGLVFCIGQALLTPAHLIDLACVRKSTDVNVGVFMEMLAVMLRGRKLSRGASVVALSSISGHTATEGVAPYALSKAALSAAVRNLALDLRRREIRVNALSPAMVRTKMTAGGRAFDLQAMEKARYPIGVAEPMDVGNAILFLLSAESALLNGNDIVMAGGALEV